MQRFSLPPATRLLTHPSGRAFRVEEPCSGFPPQSDPQDEDEHRRALFEGIDALTRMRLSAVLRGPAYLDTLRQMGLPADLLDASGRARLDERMARRFASAARQRMSPVPTRTAIEWLQNELFLLTH